MHARTLGAGWWMLLAAWAATLVMLGLDSRARAADERPALRVLFLGDNGHHQPAERFAQLEPVLRERGIRLVYTDRLTDLEPATLAGYDGLVVYANHTQLPPAAEAALLDFVARGKGFVPLHCASACFKNSTAYRELVGAEFARHGTGTFRAEVVAPEHPVMRGYAGFQSWDETYVHRQHHTESRTVLEERVDAEGREPWTWVRTHGQGRVFYTAWGHDQRTWGHPGFQNLVERGLRWACGDDPARVPEYADASAAPALTPPRSDVAPFEYVEAKVPFYVPGGPRKGDGDWNRMQLPLPPAESQKHLRLPVGFEARLFAAEPELAGKPIALAFDARGRAWVCETIDYPNELQPPGRGRDRIRICEDTDGDGRADRFTVFAEGLSIPTTLAFHRGGVLVQDGTETVFLRDTNGDDRADERHVLLTGWALGDTHGGVSNFRYGLDNHYWGMQGYNNSSPAADGQVLANFRQGFFRFALAPPPQGAAGAAGPPRVAAIEFLRSTNNNTWGLGFSEEGFVFGSTANGNPSVYLPIPNRYYEQVRGWSPSVLVSMADDNHFEPVTDRVRQVDHHGGFTAAAGHALYTARAYPRAYWNRTAFVTEPTGHLAAVFELRREGTDFRSRYHHNLVASDDEWTAPIVAEVGPDGYVWIVDWYNYIVQHNPTPVGFETGAGNAYETNLRDKRHGRIYRIVPVAEAGAAPGSATAPPSVAPPPRLSPDDPAGLVQALAHDNLLWRTHAQRLLVERGQSDVAPALVALVADRSLDALDLNVGAIHALWTLDGLGAIERPDVLPTVEAALGHPSPGVRRNALGVLPRTDRAAATVLAAGVLADADPQVQLAALLALAEIPPSARVAEALVPRLADPALLADRWLPDALTAALARHDAAVLALLPARSTAAPLEPKAREIVARVAEHHARGGPAESIGPLLMALAGAEPSVAETVLRGLATGWPRQRPAPLDAAAEAAIGRLFAHGTPELQGQLFTLATRLGSRRIADEAETLAARFFARLRDETQSNAERLAAAEAWIRLRSSDPRAADTLLALLTPRTDPELAAGWIAALAASEAAETGPALLARLGTATPAVKAALLRVVLSRAAWTAALLAAIERGEASWSDLPLDQQQALAAHPDGDLARKARQLAARGGGLPDPNRQRVIDELSAAVLAPGDAAAGKLLYKQHCAKCHVHGLEGTRVGPDLTGMAVHPKHELLVHVLDPSRSVEGNFRLYVVALDDGRVLNGLLASESRTAVELIDAEGKRHPLDRGEIEELVAVPKSLMPEGFERQVTAAQLRDLLEFLTTRGQYVPLDLRKAATITSVRGMFYSEEAAAERLVFPDWSQQTFRGVPFALVDPQGGRVPNVILLHSPNGTLPPRMPRSVSLPVRMPAKALHLLGGVGGWNHPGGETGSVSLIVRIVYQDGSVEDHPLRNGVHLADYIRRVDVPESEFAFAVRSQQVRYLAIRPGRTDPIDHVEFVKGPDKTAPLIVAVTVETLPGPSGH